MNEFQEATGAMETMGHSLGALENAYGAYTDTTTAHLNSLKAAWAEFSTSLVDTNFAKGLLDAGTDILTFFANLNKAFSGISIDQKISDADSKLDTLYKQASKIAENYQGLSKSLDDVVPRIIELSSGVDKYGRNINLSEDQYAEFVALNNQLGQLIPDLVTGYDDSGNAMLGLSYNADNLAASLQRLADIQKEVANFEMSETVADVLDTTIQQSNNYDKKIGEIMASATSITADTPYTFWLDAIANFTGSDNMTEIKRLDITNTSKVFKERLAMAGISTYKEADQDWWKPMHEWVDLNAETNAQLQEIINEYAGIQNAGIDRQTNYYQYKREQLFDRLSNAYSDYITTESWYNDLSDFGQIVATDFVNNIDYESLINKGFSQEDIEKYIYDNANKAVQHVNPEVNKAFEGIFDLKKKYQNGEISKDEFTEGVTNLIGDAFKQVNNASQAKTLTGWFNAAGFAGDSYSDIINNYVDDPAKVARQSVSTINEEINSLLSDLSTLKTALSKQFAGESISLDDFANLKDYNEALEYHNGVLTYNAEVTQRIAEANKERELAQIAANKADAQAEYTKNADEINRLNKELKENADLTEKDRKSIEAQVISLQNQNNSLLDSMTQYDIMSATLEESTNAYHNWLNEQKAAQSGDMFDDALSAIQHIDNTLKDKDSDFFGRVGRSDYKAAVDFIVPDSVDKTDEAAVQSYLDSIADMFTYDSNGNRAGLNMENFCKKAAEQGLMAFDEASGEYRIAGAMTIQEFAEGMNMSLPLVQAMFGEMEEFGKNYGSFNFERTMGDLAVSASVAASKLQEEFDDISIKLNFDDIELPENKIAAIDKQLQDVMGDKVANLLSLDDSQLQSFNTVIEYLTRLKAELAEPAILQVDTSAVSENIASVISMLSEYQTARVDLEVAINTEGADSEAAAKAQKKIDEIISKIQGTEGTQADILLSIGIDTNSVDQDALNSAIDSLTLEEVMLKLGFDDSQIKGISGSEYDKDATVVYTADMSAVLAEPVPTKEGTVYYTAVYNDSTPPTKSGDAQASGSAKAGGDWRTATGGRTLVGELGREIVVNPHTGRWYTVGDSGAEFKYIPKGSIVFNNKQSDALLKYGHVGARGLALAGGTTNNFIDWASISDKSYDELKEILGIESSPLPILHGKAVTVGSNGKSGGDADKQPDIFDWIEIRLERLERKIKKLKSVVESAYKVITGKNREATKEVTALVEKIDAQSKAYKRYMKEANSIKLSDRLKTAVRNGTIDIVQYNEETQDLIDQYQKWYEKALDAKDAIDELHESLADLYKDMFDATQTDYENRLSLIERLTSTYQNGLDMQKANGYMQSTYYYLAAQSNEQKRLSTLQKEREALQKRLDDAMASGEIDKYSEAWYDMVDAINSVDNEIEKSQIDIVEYGNKIRELEWGYFDYARDRVSMLNKEANFLIDLLKGGNLYEESGQLNSAGLASMGLYTQNYNVYMAEADAYAKELIEIERQLANDPYDTELIARKEELIGLQQQSIQNAEKEKQAIASLVKEGIQLELNALKELISKYKDSLKSAKDLYSYQNRVSSQAADIAKIEKQISAYSGDQSEETQAIVQKLQESLIKAQKDLEQTEYDKYISDSEKLLDNLYNEYEELLNKRLDDVDALISDMIDVVNANSSEIGDTIMETADSVGYTISGELESIWGNNGSFSSVIGKYGEGFTSQLTSINGVLNSIYSKVADMVANSDNEAGWTQAMGDVYKNPLPDMWLNGLKWAISDDRAEKDYYHSQNLQIANEHEYETEEHFEFNDQNGTWYDENGNPLFSDYQYSDEQRQQAISLIVAKMRENGRKYAEAADAATRQYYVEYNERLAKMLPGFIGQEVYKVNGTWYVGDQELFKMYKSGGLVDYTGLAKVDGTPANPELMLNAGDTRNFLALRDSLRSIASRPIALESLSDFGDYSFVTPLHTAIRQSNWKYNSVIPPMQFDQNNSIEISIDHVQDYNDFVSQMQRDGRFEKMLQSMTLGRAMGKSPLEKYKSRW